MSEPLIVVVDDEAPTREMIGDYIRMNGYEVELCEGGASFRQLLERRTPDLVVLDLDMPGEHGLSIVRFLKGETQIPVVMLTGTAGLVDRVVGLELGADDHLAKLCELRELLARIRSAIRRSTLTAAAVAALPEERRPRVRFGTKWLDLDAQLLCDDEGQAVQLVHSEFSLLKAFAENPRRMLTRERLLDLASARDTDAFDRAIDVRITRIRKKIEPDPQNPTV